MKKTTILAGLVLIASAGLAASACSSGGTNTANTAPASAGNANTRSANANTAAVSNTNGHSGSSNTADETPASVKAAFPDAQSFTKQHKDIPKETVAGIEKETGGKVPDTDHHSYLAFSTTGGARKQIGAATIIKANGKEMVIVYDSKEGSPVIKEIRGGDGLPSPFISQFAGKGHDDKFQIGADLKANGADDATAKAVAQTVRVDMMTMQALYGAAHSH